MLESITTPQLPADQAAFPVNTTNFSLAHVFPVTVAICVFIVCVADLPRILRKRSGETLPGRKASPSVPEKILDNS